MKPQDKPRKIKRFKTIQVITTYKMEYTEKLTDTEYLAEIEGIAEEVKKGAKEYAYSVRLHEQDTEVFFK
jgi:hypothetical protein